MEKISMKSISYTVAALILLLSTMLVPEIVFASSIRIDTNRSEFFEGDTILFTVRIDSEGKKINAIDGEIMLDHEADAISLIDINVSGSVFSLWPQKPAPSERNTRIYFTGGSPNGFISKDATLFNIVLKLHKASHIALLPENIEVYLHDGKGTKDKVNIKDLIVHISPRKSGTTEVDDWSEVVLNDTIPPEPFEIYAGQADSVFDGKKFLSFSTTDAQSGISHYEVIEGDMSPVRANDTYVLRNQNEPMKVTIIAYDSAGNIRKSVYNPKIPDKSDLSKTAIFIGIVVGIMLLIFLLIVIFRKIQKTQK
jgi:hypothetical protein